MRLHIKIILERAFFNIHPIDIIYRNHIGEATPTWRSHIHVITLIAITTS